MGQEQPDDTRGAPQDTRDTQAAAGGLWLGYLVTCTALVLAGICPVNNPDTFGHLAQGRQIAQLGHVPLRDSFSFWRPAPQLWRNYEWLSDLLSYRMYAASGIDALLVCKCVLLAAAGGLLLELARRLAGPRALWLCSLLLISAIPAARFRFTERAQVVALPLMAAYMLGLSYLMGAFGRRSRKLELSVIAALGLAHLAWVNLHGSHLLGLAVTGIYLAIGVWTGCARKLLASVLGLQLLASCISPYGPGILWDAIAHVANPKYRVLVSEWAPWQPTNPAWLILAPVVQTLGLAFSVRPLLRRGPVGYALLATTCMCAAAGFRSIRFVAEYVLFSAPAIALGLTQLTRAWPWRKLRVALSLWLVGASVVVPWGASKLPPYLGIGHGANLLRLPAASGQWLARNYPQPRLLAANEDAWFLMFAVPGARFLADGRVPFYGTEHIMRVRAAFADATLLHQLLDGFHVDTVVVRHTFEPHRLVLATLRSDPGWMLVSIEDRYSVFVRRDVKLHAGSAPQALRLSPDYETPWLLGASDEQAAQILAELIRLPDHDNTRGYQGWVRALLSLRAQQRDGGNSGFRAATNAAELARMQQALRGLARAALGAEGVPAVHAYHALVATCLCRFAEADAALAIAREEGESRETLLTAQELAVRRGELEGVRTFIASAAALPGAEHDAWLSALRAELVTPPQCP